MTPTKPTSRGAELWAKYTVREFLEAAKRLEAQYEAEYMMLMAMETYVRVRTTTSPHHQPSPRALTNHPRQPSPTLANAHQPCYHDLRRPPGTAEWAEWSTSRSRRPPEVAWTVRGGGSGSGREVRTQLDLNNGLIHAAKGGQTTRVLELLKAGAEVTATIDWRLNTALHEAAAIGDHQTCGALLEAGSDVNAKNNHGGNTPLHLACLHGDPLCVRVLLKAGADLDALNRARSTPINMIEARTTRPEAVRSARNVNDDVNYDGPEKLALESRLWAKKVRWKGGSPTKPSPSTVTVTLDRHRHRQPNRREPESKPRPHPAPPPR